MKIVINKRYGGFDLSLQATQEYAKLKGYEVIIDNEMDTFYIKELDTYSFSRNDPILVSVVEKLGPLANGNHSYLKIVEIPNDIDWVIEAYDGKEWISEKHRTWR